MNILIIKHGSLGDVFLSIGAIQSIRLHFPKANLILLTQSNYKKLLNEFHDVNTILEDDRGPIISSILKVLKYVKFHQINLIIDLQNSSRTQLYNFFIKHFTNTEILSARKFSNISYKQKPLGFQHITKNHQDQLKKIGINYYQISNLNWMKKRNHNISLRPYVIFIPGTSKSGEYKKWPSNHYGQIANYLAINNYDVYLTGSNFDKKTIYEIINYCPTAKDKIEESRIENFYDLCLGAHLIISNDTGPAHIAGLSDSHLIWLANDNNISNSSYPLGKKVHIIKSKSVKDITVNKVIKKINDILDI